MGRFSANSVHKDLENSDYIAFKRFLKESESWSVDQIHSYQIDQLDRTVQAAIKHAPGYRKLYAEHGVAGLRIRDFSDYQKLPFVDKSLMQNDIESFSVKGDPKWYVTTGGSTGIPFGFYRSSLAFAKELAAKAHQYQRVGWSEGQKQAVFRGLPIDTPEKYEFFPDFNELRMSSYHLDSIGLDRYLALLEEYQPEWIRCYPSSAQVLAKFMLEKGVKLDGLKGLLCASENLYSHQIELFNRVFSGRVFSHYGHFEQAALAGFCEFEDDYHVLPQYGYAELLQENGLNAREQGAIGEVVATSFTMDATLFIRYRTQDYAVYKSSLCSSCGRPYECWSAIEGRLQDWVVSDTGRPVSMTAINMHDDVFDKLRQFQFEQHCKGELFFKMVPSVPLTDEDITYIHQRLMVKLGVGFNLNLEIVDILPLTKRGKHRFVKQHIKLGFGDAGVQALFSGH